MMHVLSFYYHTNHALRSFVLERAVPIPTKADRNAQPPTKPEESFPLSNKPREKMTSDNDDNDNEGDDDKDDVDIRLS